MSAGALLNRAADLLEEHGWCQGDFFSAQGEYCALGALGQALREFGDNGRNRKLYFDADDKLRATVGTKSIVAWNDTRGRTKEDVVAAFRTAAAGC